MNGFANKSSKCSEANMAPGRNALIVLCLYLLHWDKDQYPETIDDQQHQMKTTNTHLIGGELSLIYTRCVRCTLHVCAPPIVCAPARFFVRSAGAFFFSPLRLPTTGSASFSGQGGHWWIAARQAGEAQLRFRQDKGKGKLFTLTRRLGSPKHSSTNGEKKRPLRLGGGGASFRKLFVLLINEVGKCVCVCVCVCVWGVRTEGRQRGMMWWVAHWLIKRHRLQIRCFLVWCRIDGLMIHKKKKVQFTNRFLRDKSFFPATFVSWALKIALKFSSVLLFSVMA